VADSCDCPPPLVNDGTHGVHAYPSTPCACQRLSLLDAPERCPAYGKDCDCPTGSAVRAICERTAANIHR
jgi:hypothetical protein